MFKKPSREPIGTGKAQTSTGRVPASAKLMIYHKIAGTYIPMKSKVKEEQEDVMNEVCEGVKQGRTYERKANILTRFLVTTAAGVGGIVVILPLWGIASAVGKVKEIVGKIEDYLNEIEEGIRNKKLNKK